MVSNAAFTIKISMALPFAGVEGSIVMLGSLRCTASGLSILVEAVSGLLEIPTSPSSRLLCDETVGQAASFLRAGDLI